MDHFELNIKIYYQTQTFQYLTGFWYLIKWALIQYLAVYIVVGYFINLIKTYVFEDYLVATTAQLSNRKLIVSLISKKEF